MYTIKQRPNYSGNCNSLPKVSYSDSWHSLHFWTVSTSTNFLLVYCYFSYSKSREGENFKKKSETSATMNYSFGRRDLTEQIEKLWNNESQILLNFINSLFIQFIIHDNWLVTSPFNMHIGIDLLHPHFILFWTYKSCWFI